MPSCSPVAPGSAPIGLILADGSGLATINDDDVPAAPVVDQ